MTHRRRALAGPLRASLTAPALVALWGALLSAPAEAQWWPWWPQPRGAAPAPFDPSLFADYIASGQTPHPAVVRIVAAERGGTSLGSGVLVDSNGSQGLVVTNHHVIRDTRSAVLVQFPDGFQSAGTVLRDDAVWDLAVIVIWRPPVVPVPLADGLPAIGEPLTIAGWGRGQFRAQTGPCTQYLSPGSGEPREIVELVASARQGDSGGAILDGRGRLAGVLFGENEGRTVGSGVTRVREILARVGSTGVGAFVAPPPAVVAAPAGLPPAPVPQPLASGPPPGGPAAAIADGAPAVVASPGDGAAPVASADAAAIPAEPVPSPPGAEPSAMPGLPEILDRLSTADGRETAVQAAGGLALAALGMRAVWGARKRS